MKLRAALKPVLFALLLCGVAPPGPAAAAVADTLKAEIDAFLHRVELSSDGRLRWDGAESYEVRDDGDGAVATLVNGRLLFRTRPDDANPAATITLDRVEVRRHPAAGGGEGVEFAILLPARTTFTAADGAGAVLALSEARASVLVEGPTQRQRGLTLAMAGGRIENKNGADWVSFGPVSSNWSIVGDNGGGWRSPLGFEVKRVEFRIAETPVAGTIERIAYTGEATGPSLAELDALRDRINGMREEGQGDPDKKIGLWLALLPKAITVFSSSKGELAVEGLTTKRPDGETLVTLGKASFGGSLTGFDTEQAALRMTISHQDLAIAPSLAPEVQVPRRGVIDLGLEGIATSALRTLAEAGSQSGPGASEAEKQQAMRQAIAAAMSLSPVLRLYEAAVEFKNVKLDAAGEAKRAPPAPIGYAASGDVGVRGFEHLPEIIGLSRLIGAELPLLKFIGAPETAPDGTPVVKFHLASALGHPITVNGSDLAAWFEARGPNPPRSLRLADPPMTGADVRTVQKALVAGQGEQFADGVYDTATAIAVARFQKRAGLNVDGVVDAKTRAKLGIAPPPSPPGPKN